MSLRVKAKFRCNSITDNGYNKSANLTAVFGKDGENADYCKSTPSGSLTISIDKDTKASELFAPKKEYYLYFEEVPAAVAP